MSKTTIYALAEKMAAAIREWNRAKQERESWKPVVGQIPPVDILGSAKKANAMLTDALGEYEAYQRGAGDQLIEAVRGLIDYRRQAGPLNFQLEKADAFIFRMRVALEEAEEPSKPENP